MPFRKLTYSADVIDAMVFDFNGVIADDETPHLLCFQQALAEPRLTLAKHDYYGAYSGMDERTCTRLLLEQRDGVCDEAQVLRITDRKADLFRALTTHHRPPLFPGATDFVLAAKARYRLAIASGGRRVQIEDALAGSAIEHAFEVIVSAEDCPIGKPDPAIYLIACDRLNANRESVERITPSQCLVIEDSVAGIRSASCRHARVGVSTTYPLEMLNEAEYVFRGLHDMTPQAAIDALALTRSRRPLAALSTPSKEMNRRIPLRWHSLWSRSTHRTCSTASAEVTLCGYQPVLTRSWNHARHALSDIGRFSRHAVLRSGTDVGMHRLMALPSTNKERAGCTLMTLKELSVVPSLDQMPTYRPTREDMAAYGTRPENCHR